jgi:GTP-binding protein LepA
MRTQHIRNFCIVAHIDHGKSTLADQLLLQTATITERQFRDRILDDMDLERERGITIKARAVAIDYVQDGVSYELNLIDTPGHVDFSYEVSRSLAACEGAILLVDATQGVQAQTVANAYLALDANLTIVPAINKIDMGAARPDEVAEELERTFGFNLDEIAKCSGRTGEGVPNLLQQIIKTVPAPAGDAEAPLKGLLFDSVFDEFRGVVVYCRLIDGKLRRGQKIRMMRTGGVYEVQEIGQLRPERRQVDELSAGQVGYIIGNIKNLKDVKVGDTITDVNDPTAAPLPGYKEPKPMVYSGVYPTSNEDFEDLRAALEKLSLNDSSFTFEPDSNEGLGFGFLCGFLGLLHMEIVGQRLERESDVDVVMTAPSVTYEIIKKNGEKITINSPDKLPDPSVIEEWNEPYAKVNFIIPHDGIGAVMKICQDRRGKFINQEFLSKDRTILVYELPLAEIIVDVHDRLKSATRGYGTMDYEIVGFRPGDLCKLDILVNGDKVDALSVIVPKEFAERRGRRICAKLKEEISRHQFAIPIQAAIGGKIVARETISAVRKDVTAKCYGGDITRKRKLLEKQKEGKKRMRAFGNVEIPQKAFLAVLQTGEDD